MRTDPPTHRPTTSAPLRLLSEPITLFTLWVSKSKQGEVSILKKDVTHIDIVGFIQCSAASRAVAINILTTHSELIRISNNEDNSTVSFTSRMSHIFCGSQRYYRQGE